MTVSAITLAVVMGCGSIHLTTEHEPTGGYNESNKCLGIHAEAETNNAWSYGILAERFKDSFNESSELIMATAIYNIGDPNKLHGGLGVGVGVIRTSYYEGAYVAPIAKVGYNAVDIVGSIQPKVPGGDAVVAAQVELKYRYKFKYGEK